MPLTENGLNTLRAEFPALGQTLDGRPIAFFDGPGGTQVHASVVDAIARYYAEANSNAHGVFEFSRRTDATVAAARAAMASLVNAPSADEIVFGPSMTALTFNVSRAIGRTLEPGDEIVVTALDHDANVAPWIALEEQGAVIRRIDFDPADCTLDLDAMQAAIGPRTKLVAVGAASNAVGTVNDAVQIGGWAHDAGAWIYVDAVQYAPHGAIDVRAIDADFLVFSTYKLFGPHLGVLWGRRELLATLPAYKVIPADDAPPDKFETGTPNFEGMAGAAAAVEYLATVGRRFGEPPGTGAFRDEILRAFTAIETHERALTSHLIAGLQAIRGVRIYGITDPGRLRERVPVVSFTVDGVAPREVARRLGERAIFVWDGDFYAVHAIDRLGLTEDGGLVRIGINHYNTRGEVDRCLNAIAEMA